MVCQVLRVVYKSTELAAAGPDDNDYEQEISSIINYNS